MAPYYILALDGGGIRGVLTATILDCLEERYHFLSKIDLFAGTSTGGILALALAAGLSPLEARDIYVRNGTKIFPKKFSLLGGFDLFSAKYRRDALLDELKATFGEKTLGDLPKKVLISSFDTKGFDKAANRYNWKAKYFHNFPSKSGQTGTDVNEKVVSVAMRTSAAPLYFPSFEHYIDGGVVSNNPSVCAIAQALDPDTGGQRLEDIHLLSIGTGGNLKWIDGENLNWGVSPWVIRQQHLINVLMDGSVNVAHYQAKQLLREHYMRANPILDRDFPMDNPLLIPELEQITDRYLHPIPVTGAAADKEPEIAEVERFLANDFTRVGT